MVGKEEGLFILYDGICGGVIGYLLLFGVCE